MTSFNLSDWALRHKSFVVYLMLAAAIAGVWAYGKLGREEDPPFTIKTMVVKTLWPGATATDTLQQITDRIEKKLEELPYLDFVRSYTKPGESVVFVNLKDTVRAKPVPDLWYQVRKKVDDIRHTFPSGIDGPVLQRRVRRHLFADLRADLRRLHASRAARPCRARARRAAARARRRQGRPRRRAGREDLSRVLDPADGGARPRRQRADAGAAGAERAWCRAASSMRAPSASPSACPASSPRRTSLKADQLPLQQPLLPPERHRHRQARLRRPAAADVPLQRRAGDRPRRLHDHRRRCAGARATTSRSASPQLTRDLPVGVDLHLVADQPHVVQGGGRRVHQEPDGGDRHRAGGELPGARLAAGHRRRHRHPAGAGDHVRG